MESKTDRIRLDILLKATGYSDQDDSYIVDRKNKLSYYKDHDSYIIVKNLAFLTNKNPIDVKSHHDNNIDNFNHKERLKLNSEHLISNYKVGAIAQERNDQRIINSFFNQMSISEEHIKLKARLRLQHHLKYKKKHGIRQNIFCKPNRNK